MTEKPAVAEEIARFFESIDALLKAAEPSLTQLVETVRGHTERLGETLSKPEVQQAIQNFIDHSKRLNDNRLR
ncbi:MAG: hypothetical protein LCH99_15220 [Proteobacteria bacterium]|nr:hypothetical protein [Pseudomonadota bacterium]